MLQGLLLGIPYIQSLIDSENPIKPQKTDDWQPMPALIGIDAMLTRGHSDEPRHDKRKLVADVYGPDMIISLHANVSEDANIGGLMVFAREDDFAANSFAELLMETVPKPLRRHGKFIGQAYQKPTIAEKGGWTERAFNVLDYPHYSAVLVELGFLTNDKDREILSKDENLMALSLWLTHCIYEHSCRSIIDQPLS